MKYLFAAVALGAAALVSGCGGGERVGKTNAAAAAPAATEEDTDATDASSTEAGDDSAQSAEAAPAAEASEAAPEGETAAPDDGEEAGESSEPQ